MISAQKAMIAEKYRPCA
jgi:hypothetical protein